MKYWLIDSLSLPLEIGRSESYAALYAELYPHNLIFAATKEEIKS